MTSISVQELRRPRRVLIEKRYVSRQIVVKVHGRCNLNCEYCYMYNMADQSWRNSSKAMSVATARQTARRIVYYVREHGLTAISIVLHGGEPFLASQQIFRIFAAVRRLLPGVVVDISVQTNATLITEAWAELCLSLGITLGVSVDGDRLDNALRLYHNGKSSHADTMRGLEILCRPRYKKLLDAILCYVRYERNPIATHKFLSKFGVPVDYLRPLGNWDDLPPGIVPEEEEDGVNPYAKYYIRLFNYWIKHRGLPQILLFDKILQLVTLYSLDLEPAWYENIEMIGPWVMGAIAIDVDGNYALPDWFKSVKEGEDSLGLNVFDDGMTRALVGILMITQERGIPDGAPECQSCPIFKVCGGGLPSERAKVMADGIVGYLNRSIYCGDLSELIVHIVTRINKARPGSYLHDIFHAMRKVTVEKLLTEENKQHRSRTTRRALSVRKF